MLLSIPTLQKYLLRLALPIANQSRTLTHPIPHRATGHTPKKRTARLAMASSSSSLIQRWGCRCVSSLSSSLHSSSSAAASSSASSHQHTTITASFLRRRTPTTPSAFAPFSTKAPAAKKGKKGGDEGGGGGGGGAEAPVGDTSKVAPVNIHKEGKDPPLLPDNEYPEWLFEIRVR